MKTAIVIPTCRPDSFRDWWRAWQGLFGHDDELIVVEDAPRKAIDAPTKYHYSHAEIDAELGAQSWIISRRDSAIRSFGFWVAWEPVRNLVSASRNS
jgi:reversibly glycosylated polypeptide